MKKLSLLAILFLVFAPAHISISFASFNGADLPIKLPEKYIKPKLGTIPVPESKTVNIPYPDGPCYLTVDYPDTVAISEEFEIKASLHASYEPWGWLIYVTYLYIPNGVSSPQNWKEENYPVLPGEVGTATGTIDSLPSLEWLNNNWDSYFGVGIMPYEQGKLIIANEQLWSHDGHLTFLTNEYGVGDSSMWTFSSFSISQPGEYGFELIPQGWYIQGVHYPHFGEIEPVSFKIKVEDEVAEATVDLKPETLNTKSEGEFVTAYIEIPGEDLNKINISSIRLNESIPAEPRPCDIGDYDGDNISDLMVKFNRSALINILASDTTVECKVTGAINSSSFEGTDTLRVL